MDIYREELLDHYKNPRNFGSLPGASAVREALNVSCGDHIVMEVLFSEDKKTIADIRFHGQGCAINQASASMLTEKVKGMQVSGVMALGRGDIEAMLGVTLTPSRVKCAILPLEALQQLLAQA